MSDLVWLRALLKALVLPPVGPLLVSALGLLLLARRVRLGRFLAWLGIVTLTALSIPAVAGWLTDWVYAGPAFEPSRAKGAQAIVILGGGIRRNAPEYGGRDTLGRLTLDRVRYGARVARMTQLPVLVTGGIVFSDETEGSVMRKALEEEFGVPVRWVEEHSRNTHQNAVFSASILRQEGIHRIVLVAHGVDMPRAMAEFADQKMEVVPAPTGLRAEGTPSAGDYLPSVAGLQESYYALYEALALRVRPLLAL